MTSDAYRWQAAMGALVGSLVADADDGRWSARADRSMTSAEDLLRGQPVPIGIAASEALPVAIGLAAGAAPLLADAGAIELIDHVRCVLAGDDPVPFNDPLLNEAARLASSSSGYVAAIAAAGDEILAVQTGTLIGLHHGVGAVPARAVSALRSADDRPGRRYSSRLVDRLLGLHRTDWYDPRRRRGPREVLRGVWLSNLLGLGEFTVEHPDGLVLSLCDVEGRLDGHDAHITFHIDDTPKGDANPWLSGVLDEVLTELDAARGAGQPVLVHCRHGASRTGLVLRLLLQRDLGLDPDDALTEAQCLWPHTSTWNTAWGRELERRFSGCEA